MKENPVIQARMERQAQTYLNLESPIFDLKNMTNILETVITAAMGEQKDREGQNIKILLSQDEFDSIHFAVMHVGDMARKVLEVWEGRDEEESAASGDGRKK